MVALISDLMVDPGLIMFIKGTCAANEYKFRDLSFRIDSSHFFTVPPRYYLVDKDDPNYGIICIVGA